MEVRDRCRYSGEIIRETLYARGQEDLASTYVTTSAVCQLTESWSLSRFVSIPLRQITSIAYERRRSLLAAVLAIAAAACAISLAVVAVRTSSPVLFFALAGGAGGLALALLMVYLGSRSAVLRISSPTDSIRVELVGGEPPRMIRFLMQDLKSLRLETDQRKGSSDQGRSAVGPS